jgi:hypothetical protein
MSKPKAKAKEKMKKGKEKTSKGKEKSASKVVEQAASFPVQPSVRIGSPSDGATVPRNPCLSGGFASPSTVGLVGFVHDPTGSAADAGGTLTNPPSSWAMTFNLSQMPAGVGLQLTVETADGSASDSKTIFVQPPIPQPQPPPM